MDPAAPNLPSRGLITPEVRRFLESMRVPCVISTLRRDGHPITSSTWYGFTSEGDVIVATPAARNKARNVRRDPRVSFLVDTKEMPYRGVAIEARAVVLPDPDGRMLAGIVERYLGPDAAIEMLGRLRDQGERVILRLEPERVRPWRIGVESRSG